MVNIYDQPRFEDLEAQLLQDFLGKAERVDVGQWQSTDIKGDSSKVTWELREAVLAIRMPASMSDAQRDFRPNLPWAEDHFQERVGGKPLNPPPSQAWWPFAQAGNAEFKKDEQFSHTYPERFWPKHAGDWGASRGRLDAHGPDCERQGIRFNYGDLWDVIGRLIRSPLTRQAYLPIWFPEDTGAPDGERVPCTLGYHFLIRGDQLHMTYHIRSCDFMRHWRDDVYMAVRLGQYVREAVALSLATDLTMGELTMHIGSFHIFNGDRPMVKHRAMQAAMEANQRLLGSFR